MKIQRIQSLKQKKELKRKSAVHDIDGKIEYIIIENKDRLCRFGYELLEKLFLFYGTKLIVINDIIQNKTYEQELTDDLISIIHYFSMKSYGFCWCTSLSDENQLSFMKLCIWNNQQQQKL